MINKLCTSLILCLGLFISCSKNDIGAQLKRNAEEKIVGKWMLDHTIEQIYHPIQTLSSSTASFGSAGDSLVFERSNRVRTYSDTNRNKEDVYEVVNPNQIIIGDKVWRMEELSSAKMLLVMDRNDVPENKRYVTRIYLKK